MGIEQRFGETKTVCACSDKYPADCNCKTEQARFFACDGGTFKGMPCTRHRHCPGGSCSAKPKCRDKGTVYGSGASGSPGGNCELDNTCGNQVCGYRLSTRLFDSGGRKVACCITRIGAVSMPVVTTSECWRTMGFGAA